MKLFIIAGESSGDLHGAQVIRELNRLESNDIQGWGGDRMQESGAEITTHINDLSVMGFSDVITKLPEFWRLLKKCKTQIIKFSPDAILFIDYSGFNLRIAKWSHNIGILNHFYIAPKTWAWRESRIDQIKRDIDFLYCILPFEEAYFKEKGINARYVGNPLTSLSQDKMTEASPNSLSAHPNPLINPNNFIALLPGSRKQEIRKTLPIFGNLITKTPNQYWQIAAVSNIPIDDYKTLLDIKDFSKVKFRINETRDILKNARLAIVTSGTATLESTLLGCPQVVVYKTSYLNYFIGKKFIKTKYISLPNLILNQNVVKELIQADFNVKNLEECLSKLTKQENVNKILSDYSKIRELLGYDNAALNVATSILNSKGK